MSPLIILVLFRVIIDISLFCFDVATKVSYLTVVQTWLWMNKQLRLFVVVFCQLLTLQYVSIITQCCNIIFQKLYTSNVYWQLHARDCGKAQLFVLKKEIKGWHEKSHHSSQEAVKFHIRNVLYCWRTHSYSRHEWE